MKWHVTLKLIYYVNNVLMKGSREALGYSTCEAPSNSPPSQLEEDGRVFNQF
jgi:hypothetical protein